MARRPPGPLVGRPKSLPQPQALVDRYPRRHQHGTKIRYLAGCRCRRCRRGNAEYKAKLNRDRKRYGPNDLVSTDKVLAHLRYLQTFGMGCQTVAKNARVAKTSLALIIYYGRKHIRRRSEARILAVRPTIEMLPLSAGIPADETFARIRQLLKWGYPRSIISWDALGNKAGALQIGCVNGEKSVTTVKKALAIRSFFDLVLAMRAAWGEGRIRRRHYVYWKPLRGRRPRIPTRERLELRPFAPTYDFTVLPIDIRRVMSIRGQIRKRIRKIEKEEHHHGRTKHAGQSARRAL
jgi:hypothetical protein